MAITRKIATFVLALALVCMGTVDVHAAGQNRAGTAAATELLIPVGARDMAMGGASVATTSGLAALHWNPAGLSRGGSDAELMVSTMSYLADIRVNYVAASADFGVGTLA
ncbi:uncharacterized protein METZ01_LOCUS494838, partial [marine metagenome]